jgi:hypothetical protein
LYIRYILLIKTIYFSRTKNPENWYSKKKRKVVHIPIMALSPEAEKLLAPLREAVKVGNSGFKATSFPALLV